jgi:hypothetical protein
MKFKGIAMVLMLAMVIVFYLLVVHKDESGESSLEKTVGVYSETNLKMTRVNMQSVGRMVESYIAMHDALPEDLNQVSLWSRIGAARWDAWGNPIKFEAGFKPKFTLISAGPDKAWDTKDDIKMRF